MPHDPSDFDARDGTPYPDEWEDRRLELENLLSVIENAWGSPLKIISAYRPPAYNAKIGGAKHSQHMVGRALDLQPTNPKDSPELHAFVLKLQQAGQLPSLGGLGAYPKWIHVDTRPLGALGRIARWGEAGVPSFIRNALAPLSAPLTDPEGEEDADEWLGWGVVASLAAIGGAYYVATRKK